jgi:predicted transcriptional regulator
MVRPLLGDLEGAVLRVLWQSEAPLSVREVLDRLPRRPAPAYTTVMTVLDRLHDKRLVVREKEARAFLYRAARTREAWVGEQAARVLTREVGPPSQAVLMAFLDSAEQADPEVVERLSLLIAARKRGRTR